jgi:hypothetical protein
MATFTKPQNLNGSELIAEFAAVGLVVDRIVDNSDGTISFDVDDADAAALVVAAHDGTVVPPEPTIEDKLESVGLSLGDLRAALGLD